MRVPFGDPNGGASVCQDLEVTFIFNIGREIGSCCPADRGVVRRSGVGTVMRRIVSSVASVVVIGTITAGCSSSALPVKPAKPVTMDGWTASVLWQQDAPVPAGADGGSAALGAVACSGATDCLAVGTAFANGDRSLPVADKFDGKSWIDTAPPKPDSSAQIDDVSCVRAWCVDVGESWHDLRGSTPFAYQYANGRWTAMTLPPLPGTFSGARFGKVACAAERSCLALFSLSDPADNAADFVLTLHNGTWAQVPEVGCPDSQAFK